MERKLRFFRFAPLLILLANFEAQAQFYTGSQQDFGKNRLQYETFLWQRFEFDRFDAYFYEGGKDHAEYVARSARTHLAELEELFDYQIPEKVEFLVYNRLSDFRQSNIGLSDDEEYNIGGVARVHGSKVFLYFEGNHASLDLQIRRGIATILVNHMMYGSNWKDVIKNSTLLSLPDWYVDGLVSYAANGWDVEIDGRVRDGIISGKYDKFNRLTGDDATYAGHSIWNYVAEVYGDNVIPNILYMTRISRNVESGYLYVIGVSLKTLSFEYLSYYQKRYEIDDKIRLEPAVEVLPIRTRKVRSYSQFRISPDSRYAVYVTNELGQYKVWLHDLVENKKKKIYRGEHKLNRIIDRSYPVVAWHPTSAGFAFVIEKKGRVEMKIYTLETKKLAERELFNLEKVVDMNYDPTGRKMVFSGVSKGQTDLYIYDVIGNRQTQLTNDPWDDLYPNFARGSNEIIFSSNRTDDTLRSKPDIEPQSGFYDIFVYDNVNKSNILTRITNTPYTSEIYPASYDTLNYTYLSDDNGVRNRYIAQYDSAISHIDTAFHYRYFTRSSPLTNYGRNILEYQVLPNRGKYAQLMLIDGKYQFHKGKLDADQMIDRENLPNTEFIDNRNLFLDNSTSSTNPDGGTTPTVTTIKVFDEKDDEEKVDINNYEFSDGQDPKDPKHEKTTITFGGPDSAATDSVPVAEESPFQLPKASRYKLNFATDYVVTQVDKSFLNANYQRFNGGGGFFNPGLNGLLKLGISDVFEDHRIVGAMRLSGNFDNNEYFLAYHDLSKRWDKTYLFHRQSLLGIDGFSVQKILTNEVKYLLKYPFSEVSAVRTTLNLRHDRETTMSTDVSTLNEPNTYHNLASVKVEYIFDNTIPRALNILNGTRFKIWGEYYREVDQPDTDFKVVGIDFRHYQRIHRELTWASRVAGSTSFGSQKLVYYLGGVDNWLFPEFDNSIPIANDQGYAYQTIATPMRGFFQNARNGNSFAVINNEIRWPLFKYLLNRPIRSDFIENFQAVGFADVGTAFTGSDPYSEDNTFNTSIIAVNPISIVIQNQREPIVWGYGFGFRSRIWGYFVRADWAWGVDDGVILDNVFYLSLSLDF